MRAFRLEILTPERVFYRGDAVSLIVPITDGMLGIMAGREPVTASLTRGEAYYTTSEGEKILFSISGGMVDVSGGVVKVLCEYALLPDEIDEERERLNMEDARARMRREQSKRDYLLSKLMLSNAINNIKVKHKKSIN